MTVITNRLKRISRKGRKLTPNERTRYGKSTILRYLADEPIYPIGYIQHKLPNEFYCLKFIIELDRKGKNDAVFYNYDNTDFETYINGKRFQSANGSLYDISLIVPELEYLCAKFSDHILLQIYNDEIAYQSSLIQRELFIFFSYMSYQNII